MRRSTGAIFCDTRPATIIRSAWRGDARNSSIPQRDRSYCPAPDAIISIAQQASPNVAGHIDCLRAQPTARSSEVRSTPRRTSSSTSSGVLPRACPSTRSTGTRYLPLCPGHRGRCLVRMHARLIPVEAALLPDVDVGHEHERDEQGHLDKAEEPQLPERHRPREKEDRLDVEDDEQ